jgi:hypothetical protein
MAKLTLTDIAAGYALISTFNANNALIEAALENTLSRDGTTPNTMSAALDMNSQLINNLAVPTSDQDAATKAYVDTLTAAITAASGTFDVTAAHDFTNQIDFSHTGGIRIQFTDKVDEMNIYHDDTDVQVDFVGTGVVHWNDGIKHRVYDSTDTEYLEWYADTTASRINAVGGAADGVLTVLTEGVTRLTVRNDVIEMTEPVAFFSHAEPTYSAGVGEVWFDSSSGELRYKNGLEDVVRTIPAQKSGTWTPTWTGFSADPAAVARYEITGNIVTVMIDVSTALGTSDATNFVLGSVPAAIQPATTQHLHIAGAVDNGANVADGMSIELQASSASWLLTTGSDRGAWTGSGSKGFAEAEAYVFSYLLADPT